MTRLSLSRPGMSVGILKAEVADLKFQNFHSKELERCLAFDALALLGGNEYLVQVEHFCTTQQFEEQKTFEKVQNGNKYLVQVDPHCFVQLSNSMSKKHLRKCKMAMSICFRCIHIFLYNSAILIANTMCTCKEKKKKPCFSFLLRTVCSWWKCVTG